MPEVITNRPSALPRSTTFVSPVTSATPATSQACAIAVTTSPRSSSSSPSSRISAAERNERPRAHHREVVHRAVHRQLADVRAGEERRGDDEGVRRERQALPAGLDDGRITQARELGPSLRAEDRHEHVADQLLRELAAAPVPEEHGWRRAAAERGTATRTRAGCSLTRAPPRGGAPPGSTRRTPPRSRPSARRAATRACRAFRRRDSRAASPGRAGPRRRCRSRTRSRALPSRGKRSSASCARRPHASRRPLFGITPIPRQARSHGSNTSATTARAGVLPSRTTARTYWFSTSARPSSSWRDHHADALEQVDGLEAGDHDRHAEVARDGLVVAPALDGADVPGREEPLHAVPRRDEDRHDRRRHEHVRDEQREVLDAERLRLLHRHRVRRAPWSRTRRRRTRRSRSGCAGRPRARRAVSRRPARRRRRHAP